MPARALLLRCLLILTLLVNGTASLWASTVMAITQAHHMAEQGTRVAIHDDEECADGATRLSPGKPHNDCDCIANGCGCLCASAAATFAYGVPFKAQHTLAVRPAIRPSSYVPISTRTPLLRPPIG